MVWKHCWLLQTWDEGLLATDAAKQAIVHNTMAHNNLSSSQSQWCQAEKPWTEGTDFRPKIYA